MKITCRILIVFALMCVSAIVAYSQDCSSYLKQAAELVSQKNYCDALGFYRKYRDCNADADVSTEIALCEKYCKLDGGTVETVGTTQQYNPTSRSVLSAQDIITLKNGNDIQAIVQEIGDSDIKYKKADNPNGPSYSLKKSEIFMIRYANGSKDVFAADDTPAPTPATTSAEVQQRTTVNQQITPYNSYASSQQQFPIQKYTFGNQISPNGSKKSPFLAGFLSFLIPGVGQFYNGDIGGGFLYMGCNIVSNAVWMSSIKTDSYGNTSIDQTQFTTGLICALIINIGSIVNAAQVANRVNIARGYNLGKNAYLNIQPTRIKQNNLLTTGKDYAYGMSLCVNF